MTWDAFTDGESGIAGYAVVLKTVGGSVVYGPTNVGLALAHNATGLSLVSGTTYRFEIVV